MRTYAVRRETSPSSGREERGDENSPSGKSSSGPRSTRGPWPRTPAERRSRRPAARPRRDHTAEPERRQREEALRRYSSGPRPRRRPRPAGAAATTTSGDSPPLMASRTQTNPNAAIRTAPTAAADQLPMTRPTSARSADREAERPEARCGAVRRIRSGPWSRPLERHPQRRRRAMTCRESSPSPITPRKTSPTISIAVITFWPLLGGVGAASKSGRIAAASALTAQNLSDEAGVRGEAPSSAAALCGAPAERSAVSAQASPSPSRPPRAGARRARSARRGRRPPRRRRAPRSGRARARRGSRRGGARCRGPPARRAAAGRSAGGSPRRSSPARARSARRRAARRPARARARRAAAARRAQSGLSRRGLDRDRRPRASVAKKSATASTVRSISSSPCASETNIASNCDGAR